MPGDPGIDQRLTDAGWRVVPYARWQAGDRTQADAIERAVDIARRRAEKADQAILARAFREAL